MAFGAGTYPCSGVAAPDGAQDLPIILRSDGTGKVIFSDDGGRDILLTGSYNTVAGIEFHMTSDTPAGSGLSIVRKNHTIIRNCRFFACQVA